MLSCYNALIPGSCCQSLPMHRPTEDNFVFYLLYYCACIYFVCYLYIVRCIHACFDICAYVTRASLVLSLSLFANMCAYYRCVSDLSAAIYSLLYRLPFRRNTTVRLRIEVYVIIHALSLPVCGMSYFISTAFLLYLLSVGDAKFGVRVSAWCVQEWRNR
jgi:hypothetical protein